MKSLASLSLGSLLLFSGCATAVMNPDSFSVNTQLSGIAPLSTSIGAATLLRTDEFTSAGLPFRNETGKSLAAVFNGGAKGSPLVEVMSSKLTCEIVNMGFAANYAYAITIRVTRGNQSKDFSATRTEQITGMKGPGEAAKLVTENAIADLAKQVRAYLGG